ncbi:hypothetical protein [Falsirhodobacter sp. 20TX0035]|uniref:hypothetical protein n=1 Tax=Falsirhodobacter sp. 20TX0035 TaxID=3022019 RepID=UPI00232A7A3C|nr:hypothetical protein [Falsirhodobacter sp. 20TX0035]MDB6454451.1 hypothetical protein [Falsirhodobacter sp. 20TX0035]
MKSDVRIGSAEYVAALAAAAPEGEVSKGKFREIILAYLDSADVTLLALHTQADIRKSLHHPAHAIDVRFGDAPPALSMRIRAQALACATR